MAEVDAFGRERSPTADSVDSAFPYVNAVVQEGLRLYPPATTAVREGKEGMALGAYDIPAGTALQVGGLGCSLFVAGAAAGLATVPPPGIAHMHSGLSVRQAPLLFRLQPFPLCCPAAQCRSASTACTAMSATGATRWLSSQSASCRGPQRQQRCAGSSCRSCHCCCLPAPPAAGLSAEEVVHARLTIKGSVPVVGRETSSTVALPAAWYTCRRSQAPICPLAMAPASASASALL